MNRPDLRFHEPHSEPYSAQVQCYASAEKKLAIVIPLLNEETNLDTLVEELRSALQAENFSWIVLFVDDGSRDDSMAKLREINLADPRFMTISFSRNFGKENAIAAGLQRVDADAVVIMDADLQHPPSIIPKLVEKWREGYGVVFAQRANRDYESFMRRLFACAFYAIFQRLGQTQLVPGTGDFVLLDRKVVDAFNQLGERTRFSKGLYNWIGFRSATVPFVPRNRVNGQSRWSFFRLIRFAIDGLISFSNVPLKVWSIVGGLVSLSAIIYAAYFFIHTMVYGPDVAGFPSLIVSIMFFSGVQLISLGFIGEYLARVYDEVKARPPYIIGDEIGIFGEEDVLREEAYLGSSKPRELLRHPLRGRFRNYEGNFGRHTRLGGGGPVVSNQRHRDDVTLGPSG